MEEEERLASMAAIGSCLRDLEVEIRTLECEAEANLSKMKLLHTKMDICRASLQQHLAIANGGVYPVCSDDRIFPELNHRG